MRTSTASPPEFTRTTATDRLLADAFATRLLVTAKDAARILDLDVATLRDLTQRGRIGCVRIGERTIRYREADLRAFLEGDPDPPPAAASARERRSSPFRRVVPFTRRK